MRILGTSDPTRSGFALGFTPVGRAPVEDRRRALLDLRVAPHDGARAKVRVLRSLLTLVAVAWLSLATAAEIWVTTLDDELNTFFPDITCSLREALITVNDAVSDGVGGCFVIGTLGVDDTILLPEGTLVVRRPGDSCLFSDLQDCGELNVRADVVIAGVGARASVIRSALDGRLNAEWAITVSGGVTAVLRDLTVTATGSAGSGGINNNGTTTLERVIVRGNRSLSNDGGGITNFGDLDLVDSLVFGNRAAYNGGGIMHRGGTLLVENSTITANDAGWDGGGLYVDNPVIRASDGPVPMATILSSATIVDNRAGLDASANAPRTGGVHLDGGYQSHDVRVENTIIASNTAINASQVSDCLGAFDSFGFNLVGVGTGCTGFDAASDQVGSAASPIDPLLGPLTNNGGPTDTHALTAGSPAIDRGPLQILDSCLATDQRGLPRANDGDGNGFLHCDIGAFEAPAATVPAQANLEVKLFDLPDPVAASSQLQYNVLVTNHGPDPASGVQITFVEPAGANVFGTTPVACTLVSTSPDTFVCPMGSLAAGASTGLSVNLTAPATPTTITATASVTSATPDPFAGDNSAQQSTVVAAPAGADLALQIRAMGYEYVLITEPILYDLEVTNAGPNAAASVVVSAQIPAGTAFVLASPECTRTVINNLDLLSCTAGTLPSGGTRIFELFLGAPVQPATVTLTASASTSTTDPNTSNNSDAFTTTVQDVPNADLFIAVNGPSQVDAAGEFVLNLIPFNNGPEASPSVFVRLTLPPDADVVDAPNFCTDLGSSLRCNLGEVAAFGSVPSYPVTVRAPATAGTATFTAEIEGASIDPLLSNNTADLDVAVVAGAVDPPPDPDAPTLDVAEGPSSPANATVGEGETGVPALQVRVLNSGTVAAQATAVTLRASGTGDDATGIAGVGLVLDLDGDGQVGAGDSLLATGTFAQDDGDLVLPIATALQVGAQQDWLVVIDFSNTAAARPLPWLALGGAFLGLGTLGLRRRRWPTTTLAILTLSLTIAACSTQQPPPPGGNANSSTYLVTLVDVQASDLAGDTDAATTGLPVPGATLTVQD